MSSITITEALAEIKTISKRIEKKRQFVTQYLYRQEIVRDPLTNQGGSPKVIGEELQAVKDLEERQISLRRGIAHVNATQTIVVEGITRSIADWLTWRREIITARRTWLASVRNNLTQLRNPQTGPRGQVAQLNVVKEPSADPSDKNVIVNVDELALSKEAEQIENILGILDGQLSLKNATLTFEA